MTVWYNYVLISVFPLPSTFLWVFQCHKTCHIHPRFHVLITGAQQKNQKVTHQKLMLAFSLYFILCHISAQDSKKSLLNLQYHIQHNRNKNYCLAKFIFVPCDLPRSIFFFSRGHASEWNGDVGETPLNFLKANKITILAPLPQFEKMRYESTLRNMFPLMLFFVALRYPFSYTGILLLSCFVNLYQILPNRLWALWWQLHSIMNNAHVNAYRSLQYLWDILNIYWKIELSL